jgi:hypothetical protein
LPLYFVIFNSSFILSFTPDAREGGLDLFLEALDQFSVGGNQRLLGFDLGDYGLLRDEG